MGQPTEISTAATMQPLLAARFPAKRIPAVIQHFQESASEAHQGDWEMSLLKAGKFVEAVLKLLWEHLGNPVPKAKEFKAGHVMTELERTPKEQADDTIRVTIPRACRFAYEIASNRGARHDPDEVNPNQMDSSAVSALIAWVLAELIRYAQKGAVNLDEASALVAGLSQKRYPIIEEVDGRVYFHLKNLSARDVALLVLWHAHPKRVSKPNLVDGIKRHGSSEANAKMGISRLKHVDANAQGDLMLLAPGIHEAEKLLAGNRRSA
jgi:hypothetical protein